ncbi:fibronectin type III domain-containing protein [Arcobacter sp. 15-2]|uniref:fibronectin type III domain-containing protein n=1 Tax=Arcobacter sp. 15-2 TaxID=3374109 RepID=UPI00399CB790
MKKSITSILSLGLIVLFSGCQQTISTPAKPKIDVTLPVIDASSMKNISDINAIALEWKKIDIAQAAGYYIIRADMQEDGKFKRVAKIDNKFVTHYLDKDLNANSKYGYKIALFTKRGFESRASDALIVSTLPNFESVSLIESISNLPRQIKILWRPHSNPRVAQYIIERTSPTKAKWEEIAVMKNRLDVEYIDDDLGDNQIFMYRIKAVTFDGIISNISAIASATTKSLPGQIKKLEATTTLPKKIQLAWGKSLTKDVIAYNIYRAASATGSYSKIYTAPVSDNRFDDVISTDGKIYFYKITTVDKDNLESKIDEVTPVMGSTLAKPRMPQMTLAMIEGNKMILNWVSTDDRTVSYNIYKKSSESWTNSKEILIPNVAGIRFEDPDVVRGVEYEYRLQAIDKHGLLSETTDKSTLMLPKIVKLKGQNK